MSILKLNSKLLKLDNKLVTLTPAAQFDDWFLPSLQELSGVRALYLAGKGNIDGGRYWTSSDYGTGDATYLEMSSGGFGGTPKSSSQRVRPIRSFVSSDVYNLHDTGPEGGFITDIVGAGPYTYYEAYSSDLTSSIWSNISTDVSQGTWATRTAVGAGLNNSNAIVVQGGHTTSAAKNCLDLIS